MSISRLLMSEPKSQEALAAFYIALSKDDRRARFHGPIADDTIKGRCANIWRHEPIVFCVMLSLPCPRVIAAVEICARVHNPYEAECSCAVSAEFRRQGLVTTLLLTAMRTASAERICVLHASAWSASEPAINTLQKMGFEPVHEAHDETGFSYFTANLRGAASRSLSAARPVFPAAVPKG